MKKTFFLMIALGFPLLTNAEAKSILPSGGYVSERACIVYVSKGSGGRRFFQFFRQTDYIRHGYAFCDGPLFILNQTGPGRYSGQGISVVMQPDNQFLLSGRGRTFLFRWDRPLQ